MISPTSPVADLLIEKPTRAAIFEKYGLDYCCHGSQSLDESCRARNIDLNNVVEELTQHEQSSGANDEAWLKLNLSQLADHIVVVHHHYLSRTLPAITTMTEKLANVHGDHHPELRRVRDVTAAMSAELESHMYKEETILFPAVKRLESGHLPKQAATQLVQGPISVMEDEHDAVGTALRELHELTNGYATPEDACNTYRATMETLKELELDLHLHIHKENNVLFKRVAEFGK
jgi:regulator of cell morphogenesis and NO signaling